MIYAEFQNLPEMASNCTKNLLRRVVSSTKTLISREHLILPKQSDLGTPTGAIRRRFLLSSRLPVELGCGSSLMPLHSATAVALLNSMLSSEDEKSRASLPTRYAPNKVLKMSEIAVQNIAQVPEPERINRDAHKSNLIDKNIEENADGGRMNEFVACIAVEIKGSEIPEPQLVTSEVEYIESKDLKGIEDLDSCLKSLLIELGSKDWVSVCNALNNVRKLSLFHTESIVTILSQIISLLVKSVKNPRSTVCKTAIMASEDIFKAYKDAIVDFLDPLLVQLLLKSSQDKKFVCEAAESALITLTNSVSPLLLLPKLQPYVKDKNPRIRAKASLCISRSVTRMGDYGINEFGIEQLIQIGASQLCDQLPESRDAARSLLLELQAAYERSHTIEPTTLSDALPWKHFCESKLPPLNAQAVIRVTSISTEGLVDS